MSLENMIGELLCALSEALFLGRSTQAASRQVAAGRQHAGSCSIAQAWKYLSAYLLAARYPIISLPPSA
jgi:hypothetical protein